MKIGKEGSGEKQGEHYLGQVDRVIEAGGYTVVIETVVYHPGYLELDREDMVALLGRIRP